jgi:inner membrane protease ATP23
MEPTQPSNSPAERDSDWGYDLYPERRGGKPAKPSLAATVLLGDGLLDTQDRVKCESRVINAVKNSPLVRLMMKALESNGW